MESLLNKYYAHSNDPESIACKIDELFLSAAKRVFLDNPDVNPYELEGIMFSAIHMAKCEFVLRRALAMRQNEAKKEKGEQ